MRDNEHGRELLDQARLALSHLKAAAPTGDSTVSDHHAARETARSAMNWLEDTALFSQAHTVLDQIGAITRKFRVEACVVENDDKDYFDTCPVSLAHTRVGLSPGFVVEEMVCSVCDADPRDCEHLSGESYEGGVAHRVIKKARLLEVSLVARPAQPDARITRASLPGAAVRAALGDRPRGTKLVCDKCLSACAGLREHGP
jgi:hypothetical protein